MDDTTSAPEPMPCPFCGSKNVSVVEGDTFRWRHVLCVCGASCGDIRVQTMGDGTREEWGATARRNAIKEWNTRAQPDHTALLRQALEALEAMQMEARARNCGLLICDESIAAIRSALDSSTTGEQHG